MLLNIIKKYTKVNSNDFKLLNRIYNNNFSLYGHDFHSQEIYKNTLVRGIYLIQTIISLQLILNKKLYFPGIGLFEIEPDNFIENYSFPDTFFQKIQLNEKVKYKEDNFIYNLLKNGKIDLEYLYNTSIQVRQINNPSSFTFYSKVETKIKYINQKILEESGLKKHELRINLATKYKGKKKMKDIKKDYLINKEFSFESFLDHIYTDSIVYNFKLIEDIILLIGYIENNRMELEKEYL